MLNIRYEVSDKREKIHHFQKLWDNKVRVSVICNLSCFSEKNVILSTYYMTELFLLTYDMMQIWVA